MSVNRALTGFPFRQVQRTTKPRHEGGASPRLPLGGRPIMVLMEAQKHFGEIEYEDSND